MFMILRKLFFLLLFQCACMCSRATPCSYSSIAGEKIKIDKDTLPVDCSKSEEIEKIISEAISLGAPIYNEGLHMACYRVYEWAAYKILYEYAKPCKGVESILKTALDQSHGDYSDTEKAWLMRQAFDKILGVPTQTGLEKESLQKKG